jgi:hypothetical protein
MTRRPDDREPLSPEDAALRRIVSEHYAPPPLGPVRRAAFDAALEARLARDRWRAAPWLAATAVAGAAAALLWVRLPAATLERVTSTPVDASAEAEFVLALGGENADFDAALPADYQALAGLLYTE